MPTVNFKGNTYTIPFDAARIADLMSMGYEVHADKGLDEATMRAHRDMLRPELEKLWGNKQFLTVPGTKPGLLQEQKDGVDFQNVIPSLLVNYNMPQIDKNDLMGMQLDPQRKNKPTEM